MSAFFVEKTTIGHILQALKVYSDDIRIGPIAEALLSEYGSMDKVGEALWALNVEALKQRYPGDDWSDEEELVARTVHQPIVTSTGQMYISARCWLYQCTEGDVPSHPLYTQISEICDALAFLLVSDHPDVKAAKWE